MSLYTGKPLRRFTVDALPSLRCLRNLQPLGPLSMRGPSSQCFCQNLRGVHL